MGKAGRWIKSFLTGSKKEKGREDTKEKERTVTHGSSPLPAENRCGTPVSTPTPKEKRRWSFRRSSATKDLSSELVPASPSISASFEAEFEQQRHAIAVAQATAAAANAAVAAAQAAAAVIQLTATTSKASSVEQIAAIKIQSIFRSYLARKALCALKGLVKLQALVRGHLVRKQATATLRCMQALVMVQVRARAQRMLMSEEPQPNMSQRQSVHRRSPQDNRIRQSYSAERGMEENVKIVEMDLGESRLSSKTRNSYSSPQSHEGVDHRLSTHYSRTHSQSKLDHNIQISPSPSALTDLMSPRACSGHFDEYSFTTAQSSPQCFSAVSKPDPTAANFTFPRQDYVDCMSQEYPFFPNYMANTESSKAKVRSQSAPKQRPITYERQTSRRRSSMEGRNIPRSVRMQRSSSHVGSAVNGYQPPWSVKLDRSTASLKDSECGSTSTVLTNSNYCRSLMAFEVHANRH